MRKRIALGFSPEGPSPGVALGCVGRLSPATDAEFVSFPRLAVRRSKRPALGALGFAPGTLRTLNHLRLKSKCNRRARCNRTAVSGNRFGAVENARPPA